MAKFATHMIDPHGDPQTAHNTPIYMDLGPFLSKNTQDIHVDRRVVGWSLGGKFRHGLLEKSLTNASEI